jgi:hypothetical protein
MTASQFRIAVKRSCLKNSAAGAPTPTLPSTEDALPRNPKEAENGFNVLQS